MFETTERGLPAEIADLGEGERYFLWALRQWLKGHCEGEHAHWSMVWNAMARDFGPDDGRVAVCAINGLVRAIAAHARGRLCYHQPCCRCLGQAETLLVALVGATQGGERMLARRLAGELVIEDGIGDVLGAAGDAGRVLARHGLDLPLRPAAVAVQAIDLDYEMRYGQPTVH